MFAWLFKPEPDPKNEIETLKAEFLKAFAWLHADLNNAIAAELDDSDKSNQIRPFKEGMDALNRLPAAFRKEDVDKLNTFFEKIKKLGPEHSERKPPAPLNDQNNPEPYTPKEAHELLVNRLQRIIFKLPKVELAKEIKEVRLEIKGP